MAAGLLGLVIIIGSTLGAASLIKGCPKYFSSTNQRTPKIPATLGGNSYNPARTGYK